MYNPQQANIWGIQINIDAIINILSPIIGGKAGKKNTEPIMNAIFPIIIQQFFKHPILLNGLSGLKVGVTKCSMMSQAKNIEEPIMNSIPPVLGFIKLNDGQ